LTKKGGFECLLVNEIDNNNNNNNDSDDDDDKEDEEGVSQSSS